ncbi:hypothetical protein ACH5RR_025288 [Cinchona calisaya]|uniref:J domain-containing protein n=1 Tax=Cinchona calisaya TaxID=153742 RepID=A0ABD2YZ83_9GENT
MECNKDEAVRAKEIAEKKFTEKDIPGAKKFACKAQNLFPGLEGLSQFLEVLDVYAASERKVNGEVDCYEVLGVHPLSDDETVRKQYRKLALALHPDKNKAVGADGAFKIISEAWSLLSDKVKRAAYDEKRNIRASYQKVTGGIPPVNVEKSGNTNNNVTSNRSSSVRKPSAPANPPTESTAHNPPSSVRKPSAPANPPTESTAHNPPSSVRKASAPPNPRTESTTDKPKANTFWTACKRCGMQYEYMAIYRNHNLLCPNCRQPFLAIEMPPPVRRQPPSAPWSQYREQQGGRPANNASAVSGRKFIPTPNMGMPGFSGYGSMSRANVPQGNASVPVKNPAQAAYGFQPTGENLKRGREEAVSGTVNEEPFLKKINVSKKTGSSLPSYDGSSSGKGEKPAKKRRTDEHKAGLGGKGMVNQMPPGTGGSGRPSISGSRMGRFGMEKVTVSASNMPGSLRELSLSETRNMLMEKARTEIRKKLREWNTAAALKSSGKAGKQVEKKERTTFSASQESLVRGMKKARNMKASIEDGNFPKSSLPSVNTSSDTVAAGIMSVSVRNPVGPKVRPHSSSSTGSNTKAPEIMTMSVPDPEFYDFDEDRIEESFGENQVWAAYDDEDGMPRYYAIIHEVLSRKPFKVRISWLNSKSTSEFGPLHWVDCGFTKTCGDFRIGKYEVRKNLNSFSHRVNWTKGARGVIQIVPKEGDVWALYRNWSSDWNELTSDDVIRQYDMVEVLQDYNEEKGVFVAPLVKVAGFKSVFQQHLCTKKRYTIPREEMFRFSHQVPSFLITGQVATARKGCRELDTAAMPLELLQLIKEDEEEGGRKAEEVSATGDAGATTNSGDDKHVVTERIVMYSRKSKGKKVVGDTINDKEETRSAGAN